jgi:hypothetical protein
MTKRIKIEKREELVEGMRVEVEYNDGDKPQGVVFKPELRPNHKSLNLDIGNVGYCLYSYHNKLESNIVSIHRLIDGIEDLIVGDIIIDEDDNYRKCLGISNDVRHLSYPTDCLDSDSLLYLGGNHTLYEMKKRNWEIYIEDKPETVKVTLEEAKNIISKEKGIEVEHIEIEM